MRQLQLDINSGQIVEEIPKYWITSDDIPFDVKQFILDQTNKYVLQDEITKIFYCPLCLHELEAHGFCPDCQKTYAIQDNNYIQEIDINKIREFTLENCYSVFDVVNGEVIFYNILAYISYNHPSASQPFRVIQYIINNAYHVLPDKMINLKSNKIYSYAAIYQKILTEEETINFDIDYYLESYYQSQLYTANLDILKNTIYRYTYIWEAKEYLAEKYLLTSNLTYIPIYCPGFEYLSKMHFYSLAFDNPHLIKKDNTTKLLLNPKGKYLDFMLKNNFDYWHFKTLKLCKIKDMALINFLANNLEIYEDILKIKKIDILKLSTYLKDNKYDVTEYYDYICNAIELGYDLKNKQVLYPQNLMQVHDEIVEKKYVILDKNCNQKIQKLAHELETNIYEDVDYIIYPAGSVEDLIKEGRNQNNCLRLYIEKYSQNACQIYFMRQKKNLDKSFITIEVKNKKIIQAKLKNNENPDEKIMSILKKWEKSLNKYPENFNINDIFNHIEEIN